MFSSRILSKAAGGVAVAAIVATSSAMPAVSAEVNWRMQTIAGSGTSEYKDLVENFAAKVEALSGGRMKIKTFTAGQLMPSSEVVEAVRSGALELGHTYLVYYAGKEPALKSINEWPAMVDPLQGTAWFYEGGGKEILREITAKHGMYYLGVSPILGEHIWSRKPIENVAAMKGIKIRASGLAADSFGRLGASVVTVPGEEIYTALQRGVVDAAEYTTLPVNYGFGLHEVTKYVVFPTYGGGGSADWIVNMKAWEALPKDLRMIVDIAVRDASFDQWRRAIIEESTVKAALLQKGATFITWSANDMKVLEKSRIDVMREKYVPDSAGFAKAFESRMKFLATLGYQAP